MNAETLLETALEELLNGDPKEAAYNFRGLSECLENEEEAAPSQEKLLRLLISIVEG